MTVTTSTPRSNRGPSTPAHPLNNDYQSFGFKLTADGAQYKLWKQIMDANVKTWIYNTCDHNLLQSVFKENCSALELLARIDEFFVSSKRSRLLQIQEIFRGVEKGDVNVTGFCHTLKSLYDVVNDADSNATVSETELVMQILRRLPESYNRVVESVTKTKPFGKFSEAENRVVDHEQLRETCSKQGFETPQNTDSDLSAHALRNGNRRTRRKEKQNGKKKVGGGALDGGVSNEFGASDNKFAGDQDGEQVQNKNSNRQRSQQAFYSNTSERKPPSLPPAEDGQPTLAAYSPWETAGFGGQQQQLPSQPHFTGQAQQFGPAFGPQDAQHFGPPSYQFGQQYGQQYNPYNQFGQHQFWHPRSYLAEYSCGQPTSQPTDLSPVISPTSLQPPNEAPKHNMDAESTSIVDKSKKIVVGSSDVPPVTHTDTTKLTFQGDIVYSRTFSEVEKATDDLLKFVETKYKDGGRAVIGLDVEWKPTFRKGEKESKAAVLQICADAASCHVMHILHSGFPQNLKNLLGDSTYLKVGVGIVGDARKVFKDHNVSVEALQDLSRLANQKFGGKPKTWGLSSLTEKLTSKQVPKPRKITLGNWEANPLSRKQLEYAATDAYVSLLLFEVLNQLPDADTVKNEAVEAMAPS